jgi:hypothetical protein
MRPSMSPAGSGFPYLPNRPSTRRPSVTTTMTGGKWCVPLITGKSVRQPTSTLLPRRYAPHDRRSNTPAPNQSNVPPYAVLGSGVDGASVVSLDLLSPPKGWECCSVRRSLFYTKERYPVRRSLFFVGGWRECLGIAGQQCQPGWADYRSRSCNRLDSQPSAPDERRTKNNERKNVTPFVVLCPSLAVGGSAWLLPCSIANATGQMPGAGRSIGRTPIARVRQTKNEERRTKKHFLRARSGESSGQNLRR